MQALLILEQLRHRRRRGADTQRVFFSSLVRLAPLTAEVEVKAGHGWHSAGSHSFAKDANEWGTLLLVYCLARKHGPPVTPTLVLRSIRNRGWRDSFGLYDGPMPLLAFLQACIQLSLIDSRRQRSGRAFQVE